jgi:subfamily B ATP-binding cassette protein HlyB/CyaB
MMLRFFRLPADAAQIQREFAPEGGPLDRTGLVRAARRLGLKARAVERSLRQLPGLPLPALGQDREGGYFIIAGVADGKVLLQRPGQAPETLTEEEFARLWNGRAILLTHRAGLSQAARRFGLGWFIPAIVKYRRLFAEVLAGSFFLQLFGLVSPLFFQVVIDKVLVHRGLTTLDVLVLGLIGVFFFEALLGLMRTYVFTHTTSRVDVELGARMFHHLTALPLAYFESRPAGQTVARVRELENIRDFLTSSAVTVVLDLLFTVVFLAVMYYYSPTLTWIVLGAIPFYAVLTLAITPALRRRVEEKFQRGAVNQSFLVESVTGMETLKSMAVEPQMRAYWEKHLAAYVRASFRSVMLGACGSQAVQLINKLVTALVLWFGARLVIEGGLSVGQLVAFNMLAGQVNGPVLRLAQLWQDFQQMRISVERLGDVLNTPVEPGYNPSRASLPEIRGGIRFERVSFRYRPDGAEVLSDLSLDIPAGQVVGIVGRSGSGKSTLTKLVQRLYIPERGRVLVDGVDLGMVDPAWLRRQVGVVLQDSILFHRSVRDNIALADPSLSMEQVIKAARMAGAHDFILQLPEGYDTVLEERGSNLSGGQRQRIAIARALATDPRILILDEATSALDYESERVIQENMRFICKGRTVLIVAHRLSAVRGADRIIALDRGRLIEDGSHDELLGQDGFYARLFRQQTG